MLDIASASAMLLSAVGANQRELSHSFKFEVAVLSSMQKGSTPSGAISGSADFGWATILAPQKSQVRAVSGGVKLTIAPPASQLTCIALTAIGCRSAAPFCRNTL